MASIAVCIHAEGSLPPEELSELADLGIRKLVDRVVLDGTVVDQAALIGVLERLRRAGLRIRDLSPGLGGEPDDHVATVSVTGQVGALLRSLLAGSVVREDSTTTSVVVPLSSSDGQVRIGGVRR